jgi:hypothetical protein
MEPFCRVCFFDFGGLFHQEIGRSAVFDVQINIGIKAEVFVF